MAHHSKSFYAKKRALKHDGDNINKAIFLPAGHVYTELNKVSTVGSGTETGKCRIRQGCWRSIATSLPDWKLN